MWTFLKTIFDFGGRKRREIIAAWGEEKPPTQSLAYLKLLYEYQPPENHIDDQTADDLDLDGLYRYVDRTVSAPGAQVLYRALRTGGTDNDARRRLEENIAHLEGTDRDQLILYLHDLSGNKDYLFPYMLYGELPAPSPYIRYVKWFQWASFACLLFGLVYPVLYVCFVPILAVNLFIHYRHKQDVGNFVDIFSRMKQLRQTAARMIEVMGNLPERRRQQLKDDLKLTQSLIKRTKILQTEKMRAGDVSGAAWSITEVFKFATLIDVTVFTGLLQQIHRYQDALERLYLLVGEVDLALSVTALRERLPFHCRPEFQDEQVLSVQQLYHPLVPDAVANNLELTSGSLLITGSNMSGKSTFIKTLNLNAISAQVLNTSFSESYASHVWRFGTSINLQDDLASGSSYYLTEVQRIGELMEYADAPGSPYMLTIDEVFKGTNTIERIAAAKAVLSYLATRDALVLVSTHDLELADLLAGEYELYHFQESVSDHDLSFDYRIKPGVMTERNAVKLLRIAGYPESVVEEAGRIAEEL